MARKIFYKIIYKKKIIGVKYSFEYFPKKQECLLTETEYCTAGIRQPSLLKSQ